MTKQMIIACALSIMSCLGASAALPESVIPQGYADIQPTPGSIVDVSANQFPMGVSNISFSYKGRELMINAANTTPALLYYNDFTTPVSSTLRTSIDEMTKTTAGVLFSGTFNQNGEYKVEIPEGMFMVISRVDANGVQIGGERLPAMTLYYEIDVAWQAQPVNGSVISSLDKITLTFEGASEVKKWTDFSNTVFSNRFNEEVAMSSEISGDRLTFTMRAGGKDAPLTTPGQYLLHIPAGAISYTINGQTRTTDEIRLTYYVPSSPEPAIWPDAGETLSTGLEYFELTMPEGFDIDPESPMGFSINDRAVNYLYRMNADGTLDTSMPVAIGKALLGECDRANGRIYLGLFDPLTLEPLNFRLDMHENAYGMPQSDLYSVVPGSLKPWCPAEAGQYCLVLSQSLYSGFYAAAPGAGVTYVTSDPYRYSYTLPGASTGIDGVAADDAAADGVWSAAGIRVADKADAATLKTLPAGLYFAKGKKLITNGK